MELWAFKKSHVGEQQEKLTVISGKKKICRRDEKSLYTKGNCSFPQHMLNYLWASTGICLIFTMETNTILQYMHIHWGSNCHGIQRRGDKKLSATRPIYSAANWTLSQPPVYHSPFYSLSSSSLLPFSPLFSYNEFLLSWARRITFVSAEDKVSQCTVGVALGRVVTEEKKLCRDPERCPGMQLNRRRTHASTTTTITTSESSSSSSSKSEGEGRGKKYIKKAREGVALSAAGTLHHRLPLWKGGRGVDRGREVLLVAALSLSLLSSFQSMHKSKFNIYDQVIVKCPQLLEPDPWNN